MAILHDSNTLPPFYFPNRRVEQVIIFLTSMELRPDFKMVLNDLIANQLPNFIQVHVIAFNSSLVRFFYVRGDMIAIRMTPEEIFLEIINRLTTALSTFY